MQVEDPILRDCSIYCDVTTTLTLDIQNRGLIYKACVRSDLIVECAIRLNPRQRSYL